MFPEYQLEELNIPSNEYRLKRALVGKTEPNEYLIDSLVQKSVDLNSTEIFGGSALLIAALKNHVTSARILLKAGASVHTRGVYFFYKGLSPLDVSSYNQHGTEMVRELIKNHAKVNAKTTLLENTPLHFASFGQCVDNIRELLEHGAMVNTTNKKGETPLHMALRNDSFKIATAHILLEAGADVNIRDIRGQSVLHVAMLQNRLQTVPLILNMNADVNIYDNEGCTPLHYAAKDARQLVKIIRSLVKVGANVNALNEKGQSALYYAVNRYYVETTRELLRCGAPSALVDSMKAVEINVEPFAFVVAMDCVRFCVPQVSQNRRNDIATIFQDLIRYAFIQSPNFYKNVCKQLKEDRVVNFLGKWSTSECNLKNFADACSTEVERM